VQEHIQKKIGETDFTLLKLDQALKKGLRLWEEGCRLGDSEKYKEDGENDKEETDDAPSTLKDVFEQWTLEVAVLNKNTGRKRLYRALGVDEIDALKEMALK